MLDLFEFASIFLEVEDNFAMMKFTKVRQFIPFADTQAIFKAKNIKNGSEFTDANSGLILLFYFVFESWLQFPWILWLLTPRFTSVTTYALVFKQWKFGKRIEPEKDGVIDVIFQYKLKNF